MTKLVRMVVDTANILFRVHAAQSYKKSPDENSPGLAMHVSLNTLKSHFNKLQPNQIALTFECPDNWRKAYTSSPECHSKRGYKANRVKDDSFAPFFELIKNFEELARNHTSLVCLSHPNLEGDDLIGGYVHRFAPTGDKIYIVSGDKDFTQLLKYPNVTLINPDTGKPREHEDPEFFMFEKCFRGDSGDNVMAAYPRVRSTRLKKAFTDDYELTKIMNETWSITDPETGEIVTHKVQDLFLENYMLMALDGQPDHIKKMIEDTLDHELANHGKYSYFQFMKFLGKYELDSIANQAQSFANLFSITGLNCPHRDETKVTKPAKALLDF
jgi:5'-3' exonuclease